jgi:hypothetical protein
LAFDREYPAEASLNQGEGPQEFRAWRGHVRQAYAAVAKRGYLWRADFWQLVLTGVVPDDSAAAVFGEWLRAKERWGNNWPDGSSWGNFAGAAAGWWAAHGDTTSIQELARRADSASRSLRAPGHQGEVRYAAELARAYLPLARRDTVETLRRFAALPDSLCLNCFPERLHRVQLLSARRLDREAAVLLEHMPQRRGWHTVHIFQVFWVLERGRVNDRLGNRDKAIKDYQFVADVWRHADPELQPIVQEARAALRRLGAD